MNDELETKKEQLVQALLNAKLNQIPPSLYFHVNAGKLTEENIRTWVDSKRMNIEDVEDYLQAITGQGYDL